MLFHCAGADVQLSCNLFVAAALYEQVQYLLIPGGHFDLLDLDHWKPPVSAFYAPW